MSSNYEIGNRRQKTTGEGKNLFFVAAGLLAISSGKLKGQAS